MSRVRRILSSWKNCQTDNDAGDVLGGTKPRVRGKAEKFPDENVASVCIGKQPWGRDNDFFFFEKNLFIPGRDRQWREGGGGWTEGRVIVERGHGSAETRVIKSSAIP